MVRHKKHKKLKKKLSKGFILNIKLRNKEISYYLRTMTSSNSFEGTEFLFNWDDPTNLIPFEDMSDKMKISYIDWIGNFHGLTQAEAEAILLSAGIAYSRNSRKRKYAQCEGN